MSDLYALTSFDTMITSGAILIAAAIGGYRVIRSKMDKTYMTNSQRMAAFEKKLENVCDSIDHLSDLIGELSKESKEFQKAHEKAIVALVRDRVTVAHRQHMMDGHIDTYSRMALNRCYDEYAQMKENTFVKQLIDDINALPIKDGPAPATRKEATAT